MEKLTFKRKKDIVTVGGKQYYRVRTSQGAYDKLVEIAEETGLTIREIADRMIDFAYANTILESEDEENE